MKAWVAIVAVAIAGEAHAQPPPPTDPYPAPLAPSPEPPVAPPQAPLQPAQLTLDETRLLQRGEVDQSYHYGGILANAVIGFGLGQAIQGRWRETGWKITAGMTGGMVVFFAGGNDSSTLVVLAGGLTLLGFYTWGLVDSIIEPAKHNRRVREIKMRHGIPVYARIAPFVNRSRDGGTAGFALRF